MTTGRINQVTIASRFDGAGPSRLAADGLESHARPLAFIITRGMASKLPDGRERYAHTACPDTGRSTLHPDLTLSRYADPGSAARDGVDAFLGDSRQEPPSRAGGTLPTGGSPTR